MVIFIPYPKSSVGTFSKRKNVIMSGQDKRVAIPTTSLDCRVSSIERVNPMLVCVTITYIA